MTVPPARQCDYPRCEREAVDPLRAGALCEKHLQRADNSESVSQSDVSIDSSGDSEISQKSDTPGGGVGYAELYLEARERSNTEQAYVPHEEIKAVFEAHGWGDVVTDPRYLEKWLVWTPDGRENPLYAHTPDLAGDTSTERDRLAVLLEEAGIGTERFIDVHNGHKGYFDTGNERPPDDSRIGGNYGVKGGRGGNETRPWLVDIDVDDYDEAKESNDRIEELRGETLAVASAHTSPERPGHLYIASGGDPRAIVREVVGGGVTNPQASFEEIRIEQQYVVGPGSEILCGCDRCTDPSSDESMGRYELANDRVPVVWSEEGFQEFLEADPAIDLSNGAEGATTIDESPEADGPQMMGALTDGGDARLTVARAVDSYVESAFRDVQNPDDRSAADAALARSVAPWLGYDRVAIAEILDDYGTSKWANRTDDSYRNSVIGYAVARRSKVSAYDPIPYWALVEYAVTENLVHEDDLVRRKGETGMVVEDPEDYDGNTYRALPDAEAVNRVLEALEAVGVDSGRDPVTKAGGEGVTGQAAVECTPPSIESEPFDPEDHWAHLCGERYDETLAHDGPAIWADPAGAGKTTNAGLAALDRNRNTAALFDKHRKAREFVTDDVLPKWYDLFHLKGAEQKREAACMDADHADDPCPEHCRDECPPMCPVYALERDSPIRQRYNAHSTNWSSPSSPPNENTSSASSSPATSNIVPSKRP